ncbi:unnamed protein product [Phytomonas sp. Hart1]|nr:unnamed protein product [Phytomonas sp. Hart1]|eukprot:CCW66928.1 unnamed protein product [Phytomonas sp. isolate Hart1]
MTESSSIKDCIDKLEQYTNLSHDLFGRPQKMAVAGDYLYWTQGKEQKLYRVLKDKLDNIAQPVIDDKTTLSNKENAKLTKEEELLRERTRQITSGVSSFRVRETDHTIFYFIGLDFFIYYTQGPRAHKEPLKVFSYISKEDKARYTDTLATEPNLCVQFTEKAPNSGEDPLTTFTFVHQNNLYIGKLTEDPANDAAPLALSLEQVTHIGDEAHQCGLADYIMQEEFSRYTGHYANEEYIIFTYTDSTIMRQVLLLKGETDDEGLEDDGVERMAYSRVGDPNTLTTIVVYERRTRAMRYVPAKALDALQLDGGVEYIPRFGFKGPAGIYLYLLNRTQEHAVVVSGPIHALPVIDEAGLQGLYASSGGDPGADASREIPWTREWSQQIPWGLGSKWATAIRSALARPTTSRPSRRWRARRRTPTSTPGPPGQARRTGGR